MHLKLKPRKRIGALFAPREGGVLALTYGKKLLLQGSVGALGYVLAGVPFAGITHPFGLALVMGVTDRFALSALAGFVLGSRRWADPAFDSTYIAAAGVVAAVRWILSGARSGRHQKSNLLPCITAGVCAVTLSEGAVYLFGGETTLSAALSAFAGLAVSAAFAYFYRTTFETVLRRRALSELPAWAKAGAALSLCSVLMGLYPIPIGPFSLGRLAGITLMLFAAYLLAPPLDSAVFAAVAAAFTLLEPAFAFAGAGLCGAGALATLFKKQGRALMCPVFVLSAALFAFCATDYVHALLYVSETLFASLVFLLTPVKSAAEGTFRRPADSFASATAAVANRLDCITGAMQDVCALLDTTVQVREDYPDVDRLITATVDKVCRSCPLTSFCWVQHYGDSSDALYKAAKVLYQKGRVTKEDLAPSLRARCANGAMLCGELTGRYTLFREGAKKVQHTQVYKRILKKQFSALCEMLESAREDLCGMHEWDEHKSKRIYDCAVRLGLRAHTAGCVFDSEHRVLVTLTLADMPDDTMLRRLTAGLSLVAGATLSRPVVENRGGVTTLTFTEAPLFTVKTAAAQLSAEGRLCGDVYSIFADNRFNVHAVLSDGMGTGADAARDGALCCAFLRRLLESGFRVRRAAELANLALSLREDRESASTLDAMSVNVFTGEMTLFKAGAAPTYCLQGSRVKKLAGKTLPVGILSDVSAREQALRLADGDIVVMLSDGAPTENGCVEQVLKTRWAEDPEDICRELTRSMQQEPPTDDVTVIVAKVLKNRV